MNEVHMTEDLAESRNCEPQGARGRPARILIIDDEAAIRDSLETLLTLEGFDVTTGDRRRAGWTLLAPMSFDLLLLDLALPGESGIDLLPRIKACSRNCRSS